MIYKVREKATNMYIGSPYLFPDKDECWVMTRDPKQAHHFESRISAKSIIRKIDPRKKVKDYTIEPL